MTMTPFAIPIPTYQCHKRVQALRIKAVVPNPRGYELHFEDSRFAPHLVADEWIGKHCPERGYEVSCDEVLSGGYLVIYEDGYMSWSPAAAFEAGYTLVDDTGAAPTARRQAGPRSLEHLVRPIGPATRAAVAADLSRYGIDVREDS